MAASLKVLSRKTIIMLLIASCLVLFGAIIETNIILESLGITSMFSSFSLSDTNKVNLALYLTLAAGSSVLILWSTGENYRRQMIRGSIIACSAVFLSLISLVLPFSFGYPYSWLGFTLTILAVILMGSAAFIGFRVPRIGMKERAFLTPVDIAMIAVFSALTAVLTSTTGIMLPSPTGGYTHIGDTAIYIASLLFGSRVGGLVGIIGPVAADLFVGYPRWFVTVLAHGAQGFISGLGKGRNTILQAALLLFAGFIMSSVYFLVNVYIKGLPIAVISYVRDLFGQSLISIIISLILAKGVEKALPNLLKSKK